jgi:hypothetical protein
LFGRPRLKSGGIKIEVLHRAFDHAFCGENLGLPDRGRRFNIDDDRIVGVDEPLLLILTTLLASWAGSLPAPQTASRSYPDRGAQNERLNTGMTEGEVIAILGEPAHKTSSTCGRTFNDPWSCKKWTYNGGRPVNNLEIRFRNMNDKNDAGWRPGVPGLTRRAEVIGGNGAAVSFLTSGGHVRAGMRRV